MQSPTTRILVVDDRPENLTAIEASLDGLEAEVVRATSGVEALRRLLEHDYALILLDVQMPGMDGYETARLVRERARTAHVPIIFLSAIDRDEHHALRGYDLGAVDFMPKPYNPAVLRAKAAVFVELHAARERLRIQAAQLQAAEQALREHTEQVEALVEERTRDLAAANEELAAQAEELAAQYEELDAAAGEREEFARQQERVKALEQADRAKDQFLGILSHELRTPLNAIQGFGSVLEDGVVGELAPGQARFVGKIMEASDSLLALVNDLLDMSRVQAGKFTLDRERVALPPLCERSLAAVASQAEAKGQRLTSDVPADLPEVDADPLRVGQILTNLVANAIKFTAEGGAITVRARTDAPGVRFEVTDTGVGIPEAEQARIFLAFTQVDMSDTRQKGGVGLGLSIVKALVEAHGGAVGVESQPGQGATFWFTLPA